MKTPLLSLLTLLSLATASFAVNLDLGSASSNTPYDRYISPVKSVLNRLDGGRPDMNRVSQLMHEGRAFRCSLKKNGNRTQEVPSIR